MESLQKERSRLGGTAGEDRLIFAFRKEEDQALKWNEFTGRRENEEECESSRLSLAGKSEMGAWKGKRN